MTPSIAERKILSTGNGTTPRAKALAAWQTAAMAIGDRIRQAREEKGLRGYQLAESVGAHSGTLSKWENNERRPRGEAVRRLALALGVRMEWLLTGEEPRTPVAASAVQSVLVGAAALETVLAMYDYPELPPDDIDAIEARLREEATIGAGPTRSQGAWRRRLETLCAERMSDSRPRAKSR